MDPWGPLPVPVPVSCRLRAPHVTGRIVEFSGSSLVAFMAFVVLRDCPDGSQS